MYALSDFLIMVLSWLVKQSLRAFSFQSNGIKSRGGDAKKLNKKEQEVECR